MSYLKKHAFLQLKPMETFTITLPGGQTLRAREMSTKEQSLYLTSAQQHQNPVLQLIMLALLCLVDPENPDKRWFNAESQDDMEALGALDIEILEAISKQYNLNVNPPRTEEEIKQEAKNSETTGTADDSGAPVENSESLILTS